MIRIRTKQEKYRQSRASRGHPQALGPEDPSQEPGECGRPGPGTPEPLEPACTVLRDAPGLPPVCPVPCDTVAQPLCCVGTVMSVCSCGHSALSLQG